MKRVFLGCQESLTNKGEALVYLVFLPSITVTLYASVEDDSLTKKRKNNSYSSLHLISICCDL